MIKYRIKTKQEFIDKFGKNWRYEVSCGFIESMDHLLEVEVDFLPVGNSYGYNKLHGWNISDDMIIEKYQKIDYNAPRKLIYD